jgi:flagellar biosynthesis protein FliR
MMSMELTQFDPHSIAAHAPAWTLVLARVGGVCMTAPMTIVPGVPWLMRIAVSLMLGVVLIPVIEPMTGAIPAGAELAWLALMEALIGGVLGLSASLIIAAARQAGDLVAAQAGFSTSALLDPESGEELTALGHLYGLIALAVFLALNGPLVMIGALIESYRTVPAGGLGLNEGLILRCSTLLGRTLALSLQAAAPPAVALALAGMVMGWIGRLAPAVPVMTLSVPIRSAIGMALVFLTVVALAATLSRAWAATVWGL